MKLAFPVIFDLLSQFGDPLDWQCSFHSPVSRAPPTQAAFRWEKEDAAHPLGTSGAGRKCTIYDCLQIVLPTSPQAGMAVMGVATVRLAAFVLLSD